ncbi:MAG TPA: SCO family protein [Steroidobacteraceae bacterium]|nr:SCO family protein [Steroidobacteraceae bacterium]
MSRNAVRATRLLLCAIAISLTAGLTAAQAPAPASGRVQFASEPRTLADFELEDQDGRAMKLSALRGKPVLVFFGFAHCPDVCPSTLQILKSAHASKDKAMRRVQVIMISIDGERDSPSAMKAYLAPLSKDFIGLTGEPAKVQAITEQFQALFFKGPPLNAAGDYNMQHTSQIYLVDSKGRLRATFFEPPVALLVKVTSQIAVEKG